MRIIMLGAPGAGKGTQASIISKKMNIPHISTGDIFRYNIKNNTKLGIEAKSYIDKGLLVPDELTINIVKDRLKNDDCKKGFLLDGFPRTINQAEALDKVLSDMNLNLNLVLNIFIKDEAVIKRLSGRRVCPNCNAGYHLIYSPTKLEGICDECKSEVIQRNDDKEETILERLKTYHVQTEPLEKFYEKKGLLKSVDSQGTIEQTKIEVFKVLGVE
ncbi:MAG: adenylate kinase [Clostridiales bacterium]